MVGSDPFDPRVLLLDPPWSKLCLPDGKSDTTSSGGGTTSITRESVNHSLINPPLTTISVHRTRSTTWERPGDDLPSGWEMRRDPRGRCYFLDHNTRSTTWQRPSTERLAHFQSWQGMRAGILLQGKSRFLYQPQPTAAAPTSGIIHGDVDADVETLGPLPDGWERRVRPDGRTYWINHVNKTWVAIFYGVYR